MYSNFKEKGSVRHENKNWSVLHSVATVFKIESNMCVEFTEYFSWLSIFNIRLFVKETNVTGSHFKSVIEPFTPQKKSHQTMGTKNSTAWNQINNASNILFESDFLISFSIIFALALLLSCRLFPHFLHVTMTMRVLHTPLGCSHWRTLAFHICCGVLSPVCTYRFRFVPFFKSTCRYIRCFWQDKKLLL